MIRSTVAGFTVHVWKGIKVICFYEQARRKRAAIRGFTNYLEKYKFRMEDPTIEPLNCEPE